MARYAMVENTSGIVVNVVEWSGDETDWRAPDGYTMVLDEPPAAGPGFRYDGTKFVPPPSGASG